MINIFENKKFTTSGVAEEVPLLLQMIMWNLIDDMPPPKDYLQVFECTVFGGKQKITHIQEEIEMIFLCIFLQCVVRFLL